MCSVILLQNIEMIYYAVNVKNGRKLLDVSKRVQEYNWKEEEKRHAFHKKMKIDQIHKGASDIVKFDRSWEQFVCVKYLLFKSTELNLVSHCRQNYL